MVFELPIASFSSFVPDALVAYWFFRRFGIAEESLGLLLLAVHLKSVNKCL